MAHSSRHELTRYIRLFCSRSLQAIVQSRLKAPDSETRESKAKPDTPDWFHLNINTSTSEMKDIYENCKLYLSSGLPNSNGEQLICQISINQPDTDRAQVIEIWQISIEEQIKDEKINYPEVYEKQCILMKSIISLSRTLPAYQAARHQHDENFYIKYDIYKKEPDLGLLGESRGSLLIGRILTPFGELTVSCTYRRLLGFGRPSNTPSFRYKTSSRRDIATHLRRQRPHSECSNSPGTLPPPNYKYSGSPSSGFHDGHLHGRSTPIKARQALGRTSSNASSSPAARSPPNIKESPARFIPAPKPINALDVDQAIDINKPIRGAFVRREVVGSVPDSAPDFDLMGPDGRNPVRYRANSHRSLKSNESHDSRSNQGPELEIEDDLIGRLSLDNQSSEDVMLPTAGAFVRKSTSQKLYESVQQPPEISTLKKRMYENPEALNELHDLANETREDEFDDFLSGLE